MDSDFSGIGANLLKHAEESARKSHGVISELFPFIYQAAERLSTRAISEWLEKEQGVKLSFVTIAKALREPQRYLKKFAIEIEDAAMRVQDSTSYKVREFLYNGTLLEWLIQDWRKHHEADVMHQFSFEDSDLGQAVKTLREKWFVLSPRTRREIGTYVSRLIEISETTGDEVGYNFGSSEEFEPGVEEELQESTQNKEETGV